MSTIPDPQAALSDWLASGHRWLTVTGLPGLGQRSWIDAALAAQGLPLGEVCVVEGDAPPPPAARIIRLDHRRHHHPEERVIELAPLSAAEARRRLGFEAERIGVSLSESGAAAIVDRVGGHPMALRLLARRLTALTLPELIDRLDAPSAAGRDPLMHAQAPPWDALRRALGEAIDRVPAPARRALAIASLFAGRFTVSSLSRVAGGDRLDAIQALRDHSLLARGAEGLWLRPVVRRYVRALLPAAPAEIVLRFARWRGARAAELARLARRGAPEAVNRVAASEPELRAMLLAFDGFTPDADGPAPQPTGPTPPVEPTEACDAALSLAALAEHRRSAEVQRRLAEWAARRAAQLDDERTLLAHVAAGRACRLAGDPVRAGEWLEAVRALSDAGPDDQPEMRFAWSHERGALAAMVGDRARAAALAGISLSAARALGDPITEARAWINVGVMRHGQHDLDGAAEAYTAARHISRRIGAQRLLGISALNVCLVDVWRSRLEAARAAGEEALAAFVELGDRRGEGTALNNLGMIALERGSLDRAEARFTAAEACHAEVGFRQHRAHAQLNLAEVALERGDRGRHDAQVAALERLNGGHAEMMAGPGPLRDRALGLHLARSRARSALLAGEPDRAARALAEGRAQLGDEAVPAEQVELELLAVEIALARGDQGAAAGAVERARAAAQDDRREAKLRAELLSLTLGPGDPDAAPRLADGLRAGRASLAVRRTLRAVWPTQPRATRREARALVTPAPALCLDPATCAVRLPDGRWASLARRKLVWTLMTVLFDAEQALAPDAVIAAVWPGEQIHPDAANNRLYNAVALLRKAGLAQWLERVEAGYRLAPALARTRLEASAIDAPD